MQSPRSPTRATAHTLVSSTRPKPEGGLQGACSQAHLIRLSGMQRQMLVSVLLSAVQRLEELTSANASSCCRSVVRYAVSWTSLYS